LAFIAIFGRNSDLESFSVEIEAFFGVWLGGTIDAVTDDRGADIFKMNAKLMSAAGSRL
jgi:hypothetical protein